VITEQQEALLGNRRQHGAVLLAWDSVQAGAANPFDGQNVVFHEFAHQLDQEDGRADERHYWARREPFRMRIAQYSSWARIMAAEYDLFCKRQQRQKNSPRCLWSIESRGVLAVATECFFEKPKQLLQKHPALYSEAGKVLPPESR